MSNPRERVTQATHIDRCYALSVMNPREGRKLMMFQEQTVVTLGERAIEQEAGSCALEFDPDGLIADIDPATDQPTGETFSQAHVYRVLHSAYRHAAKLRDDQRGLEVMRLANLAEAK